MVAKAILWSMLVLPLSVDCATLCEQFFRVLAKSPGKASILAYQEQMTGECEQYRLHLVFIHDSVTTFMERTGLTRPPTFILDYFEKLGLEEGVNLLDSAGIFRIGTDEWFCAPPEDTVFSRKWVEYMVSGGDSYHDWCVNNRDECYEYPVFHGVAAKLINWHYGGMYRNYSISQAIYYPASRVIVMITHQPRLAVGLDTMHGVLVYQLGQPMTEVQKAMDSSSMTNMLPSRCSTHTPPPGVKNKAEGVRREATFRQA